MNDAVRIALAEDLEDLNAFQQRSDEPTLSFEEILKKLKAHGQF